MMFLRAILLLALFTFSNTSIAKDTTNSDIAKAQSEALNQKMSSIMAKLSQEETVHFMTMYTNYTFYSTVKAVREDVKDAAAACVENNKSMKKEINDRFSKWDNNVGKSLKSSYDNTNNLALAQNYVSQQELKILFGLVDELRSINSSRFETTPVTTPEACEFMLSKMDETEKQMVSMLRSTLASYPNGVRTLQK